MQINTLAFALLCLSLMSGVARGQTPPSPQKTITFGGYQWIVRGAGKGGPGPNQWSTDGVWLDKSGQLHLKIRKVDIPATSDTPARTEWQCAELYTTEKLGAGSYEFQVIGPIDRFDPNIVLGLFDYPGAGDGEDGTNEIDIEFAHWGNPQFPNGNYTIYPASGKRDTNASHTFRFAFKKPPSPLLTTHRFHRDMESVAFESFLGEGKPPKKPFAAWRYQAPFHSSIPQKRLPVHINLWLFAGHPPTDDKEVEIVIRKFTFTPAP